jgi:hypothetical protein
VGLQLRIVFLTCIARLLFVFIAVFRARVLFYFQSGGDIFADCGGHFFTCGACLTPRVTGAGGVILSSLAFAFMLYDIYVLWHVMPILFKYIFSLF